MNHKGKEFDKAGVIYALGSKFGKFPWENPGKATPKRIIAKRSSTENGRANDVLENEYSGGESGTKNKENSWWCVDLTEKYSLYLTHYSLRHGRQDGMYLLCNWRLEGSLDGKIWETLKEHENDTLLKRTPHQATWAVDGKFTSAFRYFRIYQTGQNTSKSFNLFLSGIELYGVLIEVDVSQEDATHKEKKTLK